MKIQEIARLAGVSAATVSRVFSHQPGIKEEVRQNVLAIARKHNYHPRFSSRQKNVVIITPYDSVFPVQSCVDMILMSLAQVLPKYDFRIEILPVNNQERLESIQFCGAVAIGVEASEFLRWEERFSVPLIVMDRSPAGKVPPNVCFVHSGEAQGMAAAVDHLYTCGCRRIGCIIHGSPERGNALLRFNAVSRALKKHSLPYNRNLVCYSGDGTEKYVELIGKMLKQQIDALFCPGGNAGLMALYALSLFSRRIPDDISLIASEQTAFSQFTVPPQTTISPDYHGLAEQVARILTGWLDNEPLPGAVSLPYELKIRESTAVPE